MGGTYADGHSTKITKKASNNSWIFYVRNRCVHSTWSDRWEFVLISFFQISSRQEYTRAALIACFHLKIRLAIDILSKGADSSLESSNLRMAAIALSGFSFDKSAIWRSQCATAQTQINDPHLRSIFAFLIPDSGSYDKVLVNELIVQKTIYANKS